MYTSLLPFCFSSLPPPLLAHAWGFTCLTCTTYLDIRHTQTPNTKHRPRPRKRRSHSQTPSDWGSREAWRLKAEDLAVPLQSLPRRTPPGSLQAPSPQWSAFPAAPAPVGYAVDNVETPGARRAGTAQNLGSAWMRSRWSRESHLNRLVPARCTSILSRQTSHPQHQSDLELRIHSTSVNCWLANTVLGHSKVP